MTGPEAGQLFQQFSLAYSEATSSPDPRVAALALDLFWRNLGELLLDVEGVGR